MPVGSCLHNADSATSGAAARVLINETLCLENVETGLQLMSDLDLIRTDFGTECRVYAVSAPPANAAAERKITWSLVNEKWTEEVNAHTKGQRDTESEQARRDNFSGDGPDLVKRWQAYANDPAFQPPSGDRLQEATAWKRQAQTLIAAAQVTGFKGVQKEIPTHERVLAALRAEGMHSVVKVRRACALADHQQNGEVSASCFQAVLAARGLRILSAELAEICAAFASPERQNTVCYTRFLEYLGDDICDSRRTIVQRAYQKLYVHTKTQQVTMDDLLENWNPQSHPGVRAGTLSEKDAYMEFTCQWHSMDHADGYVSPEAFMGYYRDVSIAVNDPEEFVTMVKLAWGL